MKHWSHQHLQITCYYHVETSRDLTLDDCDRAFGSLGLPLIKKAWVEEPPRLRLPPQKCSMAVVVCPGVRGVPSGEVCPTVVPQEGSGCYLSPVSPEGCALCPLSPEGMCCFPLCPAVPCWNVLCPAPGLCCDVFFQEAAYAQGLCPEAGCVMSHVRLSLYQYVFGSSVKSCPLT